MEFGIEPKSNKEEIYKRVIPNRTEKIVGNVKNEYEDYNGFDDKGNQNLLKIEVNLENNKTDLLVIYPKDDFVKVVDDFCNKHELTEDKDSSKYVNLKTTFQNCTIFIWANNSIVLTAIKIGFFSILLNILNFFPNTLQLI